MTPYLNHIAIFILLLLGELLYFFIAKKCRIFDKPNERSSHTHITVRGGGIIFYVAVLLYFLTNNLPYPWFVIGLSLMAIISFIDDIQPVMTQIRLIIQIIGFIFILYQFNVFYLDGWKTIIVIFIVLCMLNVYNFMDGINGMTALYSLITLGSLSYINIFVVDFINQNLITTVIIANVIFLYFNCRIKAKCFAGDVGAICMGCIVIFLMAMLIMMSYGQFSYMTLLVVYGADGGFTVIRRLFLKKNIFHPHRSQIFQLLSNEGKIPQPAVSAIYAGIQLLINIGYFYVSYKYLYMFICAFVLASAHLIIYNYFNKKFKGELIK